MGINRIEFNKIGNMEEREKTRRVDYALCRNYDVGKNGFGVRYRNLNWILSMALLDMYWSA